MMSHTLTTDQLRCLILISRFSSAPESKEVEERWIKKIPLMALIGRGVMMNVFVDYDMAPSLIDFQGDTQFANISKEGEDDVAGTVADQLAQRHARIAAPGALRKVEERVRGGLPP